MYITKSYFCDILEEAKLVHSDRKQFIGCLDWKVGIYRETFWVIEIFIILTLVIVTWVYVKAH